MFAAATGNEFLRALPWEIRNARMLRYSMCSPKLTTTRLKIVIFSLVLQQGEEFGLRSYFINA